MVEFQHNRAMDRWDAQLPYQLGDIKDMKTVAHIEDGMIFFVKTLTINDARKVLNGWEEFKVQLDRNPTEDLEREKHFELDPDGQG